MGFQDSAVAPGATPLSDEEKLGLRLTYITTHGELNQAEQQNVLEGRRWALSKRKSDILSEKFIKTLHKKMFGEVWEWAGEFRKSEKSIGRVPAYLVGSELRKVLHEVRAWEAEGLYGIREIAIRLHHQIVWIHPFPNGNGRHSRLLADTYLHTKNERLFGWSGGEGMRASLEVRGAYLAALKAANDMNYQPLLQFAEA